MRTSASHSNDATNPLISVPVVFTVTILDAIFDNGFDPYQVRDSVWPMLRKKRPSVAAFL